MEDWTEKEPNVVARGKQPDGTYIYVKAKPDEPAEDAIKRVAAEHGEVKHWERKTGNPGFKDTKDEKSPAAPKDTPVVPTTGKTRALEGPGDGVKAREPSIKGAVGGQKRRGALLVTSDLVRDLKRAAMDRPEAHKGITYTDDPAEASARGLVIAVAPRRADEIKDVTAVVEEAPDLSKGFEALGGMTDDKVLAHVGNRMFNDSSVKSFKEKFFGGK